MAFIPAERTARATIEYSLFGHQCVNVFHMQSDVGWTESLLDGLCSVLNTWWDSWIKPSQSANVEFVRSTARDVSTADGLIVINTDLAGTNATQIEASHPGQVAAVITWRTGQAGRSKRGRSYIAGIPFNESTGDTLSEAWQSALLTAAGELITACQDGDYPLVVASYQSNKAPRTAALLTPITVGTVDRRLDTQRRRLDPTPS